MNTRGFSLPELLMALTITLCISLAGFRLFQQNERIFNDQYVVSEMQQTARSVTFQISEEARLAGQGVPNYESTFDSADSEAAASILSGSDGTHLRFRAALSNVESSLSSVPSDHRVGTSITVSIDDAAAFSTALGTSTPVGRYVYVTGSTAGSCRGWSRAELSWISSGAQSVNLIPRFIGDGCQAAGTLEFIRPQRITLEECVSIYLSGSSVWRTTASDMSDQTNPVWSTASELGRNFTALTFTYYDSHDAAIVPVTLTDRLAVARIDVSATVQAATKLSSGARPVYTSSVRSIPVNLRFR